MFDALGRKCGFGRMSPWDWLLRQKAYEHDARMVGTGVGKLPGMNPRT